MVQFEDIKSNMRYSPWQFILVNDIQKPLPDFISNFGNGLLYVLNYLNGDDLEAIKNILWSIDIKDVSVFSSYISKKNVDICWSYNENFKSLLTLYHNPFIQNKKYIRLVVSDCNCDLFLLNYVDCLKEILTVFDEVILLNEHNKNLFYREHDKISTHLKRRRPCRYPFEYISIGRSGKLYPCPYACSRDFGKVTGLTQVLENNDYLLFLSAHLCGFLEDYPFCKNCQYWLDGWLGEEKEYLQDKEGNRFELLWEGHSCTIKRNKKK